jgi:hypothetical protein
LDEGKEDELNAYHSLGHNGNLAMLVVTDPHHGVAEWPQTMAGQPSLLMARWLLR